VYSVSECSSSYDNVRIVPAPPVVPALPLVHQFDQQCQSQGELYIYFYFLNEKSGSIFVVLSIYVVLFDVTNAIICSSCSYGQRCTDRKEDAWEIPAYTMDGTD
jgi:hypothetical protein